MTILSLELEMPLTRADERRLDDLIKTDRAAKEAVSGFEFKEKLRRLDIRLTEPDHRGLRVPPCIDSFLKDINIEYEHPRLLQKAA